MTVTKDVQYVGVNDHQIDLFEGQYAVPNGMSYNSYVILDEKTAVMDTVDAAFGEEWLSKLEAVLGGRAPDYLIVHHMEPDHSANIAVFAEKYTNAVIVATAKAFTMMKQFFGTDFADRRIVAGEGGTLSLGRHTLTFLNAPMVHWPEVMMTYDSADNLLFSADAFGKFGALDRDDDWDSEARRYYIGIVGKFGVQVQALLKKVQALDLRSICPLHGPVLTENLAHYIGLYQTWSSYEAEEEGVLVAYTSVYGNTRKAAEILAEKLLQKGCRNVVVRDLARSDMAENVSHAFRYSKLVLASPTYNADVFPFMRTFLDELTERGYKNRTVGLIENGSWAPVAAKVMTKKLENLKNITLTSTMVTIRSAVQEETCSQLEALAEELCQNA